MDLYKKLFSILNRKQRIYCFMLFGGMLIGAILEAIGISAIMPLIALMGNNHILEQYPQIIKYTGISDTNGLIFLCTSALAVFYICKNIFLAWLVRKQISFSIQNQIYFGTNLNALYIDKPYTYHLKQNSANLLRNINASISYTFSVVMISVLALFTELITALIIWSMLIVVDFFIAIVVAGFLSIIIYFIWKAIRKKTEDQGNAITVYSALYAQWLNQGLGGIKETKIALKENYFKRKFTEAYTGACSANEWMLKTSQLPRYIIEACITCSLLIMIIVKISTGTSPADIVPVLGVLALAAFRLMPSANKVVSLVNAIKFYAPSFEVIYDDLLSIKENEDFGSDFKNISQKKKLAFSNEIKINDLQFSYHEDSENVLNNISFNILANSFVGIVGKTGAGKTTFVDILLGLFEPKSGTITVDGVNIFDDIRVWQANLAYVPQSIYLIDGSIRENIALGVEQEDIDEKQIEKVLKMADLYDFVQTLPDGLGTRVGERGIMLSGGQRQRIGIARALYYEPKVLILDEATSALDNETEKNITDTLLKLKGQITIIAIAHRVSTLEQCDFKVEFEDGQAKVIAQGELS